MDRRIFFTTLFAAKNSPRQPKRNARTVNNSIFRRRPIKDDINVGYDGGGGGGGVNAQIDFHYK